MGEGWESNISHVNHAHWVSAAMFQSGDAVLGARWRVVGMRWGPLLVKLETFTESGLSQAAHPLGGAKTGSQSDLLFKHLKVFLLGGSSPMGKRLGCQAEDFWFTGSSPRPGTSRFP